MTMATEQKTTEAACGGRVQDRVFKGTQSYRCGRPVKADGLCGVHLAAARRAAEDDRKRAEKAAAGTATRESAESVAADISALLGPDLPLGQPHYSWSVSDYTPHVVLSIDTARALLALARLTGEK